MKPLKNEFFIKRASALNKLDDYNNILEDRVSYIITSICDVFGYSFNTWYFPDAEENEVGNFDKADFGEYFDVVIESSPKSIRDWNIILDGKVWSLYSSIPKSWLTKNFEKELEAGRLEYIKSLKDNKNSRKQKLIEKKILLEQLKQKLTAEELKFLKVTLK